MQTKTLFASIIAALVIVPAFAAEPTAAERKITTSKNYVDTQVATKQNTIPVAGTNTSNAGTSVVMYTGTAGTVGERGIYSGTNYTSNDANKLVTASALNSAVTTLPTMATSKLTCANSPECTLWTIDDQTVYGNGNSQGN